MQSNIQGIIHSTEFNDLYQAGVSDLRAALNAYLLGGNQLYEAWYLAYARFLNIEATDAARIHDAIYDDFVDNTRRVNSRQFTLPTPSADPANNGSGEIRRLTVDAEGFAIERTVAETKFARCVQDAHSGASRKGAEVFEFRGQAAARDALQTLGSGRARRQAASHSIDSLLLNPSFDGGGGGTDAAPTSITNWSTDVAVSASTFEFRPSSEVAYLPPTQDTETVRSLQFNTGAATIMQKLSVRRTQLNSRGAYEAWVAWNRSVGGCSGTLTLRLGTQSNQVAVTSQAAWNRLFITTSPGTGNWFENFNTSELAVEVGWSGTAGLLIDDVTFVPYNFLFDATGYAIAPGHDPFLGRWPGIRTGDQFDWTDTEVGASIQRWYVRKTRRHLPHSTNPTIADPP
jgi:hypothetical protein